MRFFVPGTPAPQGSKTRGRHGGLYESSKAVGPWRERVALAAQFAVAEACCPEGQPPTRDASVTVAPARGPMRVGCEFVFQRPAGHSGKRGLRAAAPDHPAVRPDIDKLCRAVLDALTGIVFASDAQVVELRAVKVYGPAPGCWITVEPL